MSPRDGGAGQNADDRDEQNRVLGAEQVEERVDNEAARGGPGQIDELVPADRSRVGKQHHRDAEPGEFLLKELDVRPAGATRPVE